MPASFVSVTMYEPAALDLTAEKKLEESEPRYQPWDGTPIQMYRSCARLQLIRVRAVARRQQLVAMMLHVAGQHAAHDIHKFSPCTL